MGATFVRLDEPEGDPGTEHDQRQREVRPILCRSCCGWSSSVSVDVDKNRIRIQL